MSSIHISSITKKLIMSLSELFLVLFLTLHCVMNLVTVFSLEAYDEVSEFMGTNPVVQFMVLVLYSFTYQLKYYESEFL